MTRRGIWIRNREVVIIFGVEIVDVFVGGLRY